MIKKYTTVKNQSWFDLALQLTNDASNAFALAKLNGYSFLNEVLEFTEIMYEVNDAFANNVIEFNNQTNTIISTGQNNILLVNSWSNDFNLNEFF